VAPQKLAECPHTPDSEQEIVANRLIVSLIGALAPWSLATAQPRAIAEVPVRKVVLFSSGVGYFEHAGSVRGNGSTELRFKTSQINDILKSIVLQDQDGGRVGAITYPSQDPLAKTLKSFQVDITQNPSLADLLNQLRGAHVSVQAQAERFTGTILGVERREKPGERGEPAVVPVLNLLAGATIRAVELQSISNLSLDDLQLQDELTKALSALVQARDQDKKPVTITFTGSGDRRVRIGYVVEAPIWKTSYRLLLDDKGSAGSVQGWAIVENQTESDWNDVSLSLVSGRPISFMMDLYRPLYSTRPTVVPELFAGLRPQMYEPAMDSMARAPLAPAAGGGRGYKEEAQAAQRRLASSPDGTLRLNEVVVTSTDDSQRFDSAASVRAVAAAAKLGELFQYTVPDVTLARQKSAMLPIVTDSVEVERLSIYNSAVLRTNPLNGVRVKNTTGKHLLQGPVTVLEKGSYAGDARIDNLPPGQERLLSYGVDLDILVDDTKNTQTSSVVTARIHRGMLWLDRKLVSTREYAMQNKGTNDKTLVIEHPFRAGWKLVDTQKPVETTPSVYRFKGSALPGKVSTLVVKEELTTRETISLLSIDIAQLLTYSKTAQIPPRIRDAIARAVQLKQAMEDLERQRAARDRELAEITAEQTRIRENMKTVAPSTQYYERLLTKLNEQESTIERLQRERDALATRRDAARKELEQYLDGLTLE
jgi:hypothetical protein